MPAQRAKGPEDYGLEFVSSEQLNMMTSRASSPWAPVLEEFVKSGEAAIQIKVPSIREGNRLTAQLRKSGGQWFPQHKFGTKTIKIPNADGEIEHFAFLIITARPGD